MTNQQPQQFTQEEGLASRQAIADILREANLPIETLAEIGSWAEAVITNPARFPEFQAWLRSQGLEESEIPTEPDMQELSSMVAIGNTAESMMEEQSSARPAPGGVAGPVSPEQMASMASMGRNGDTQLAHINGEEAAMLKQMGGTGTINPATGLMEYGFFSDLWDGVKNVVKQIAPFVLPAVAIFVPALIPAIGTYLGASAALAPIIGSAVLAGGVTALSGGSATDVLKSAALSGLGSYITPVLGKYVSSAIGVTSPVLTNVLGSAAFAGGLTALRGGTLANILKDAATGGAASYLGQIASSAINSGKITNAKITQSAFDDAAFAAADAESLAKQGLSESQIKQTLRATGLSDTTAGSAAKMAVAGTSASDIAIKLSNAAGATKNLYTDKETGVQNSVIGGGNVAALETVQRIEDARFIAEDIKQLKAQGLSNNQIRDNLIMAGVNPSVAGNAVNQSNNSIDSIVTNLTSASAYKTVGFFVKDFDPAVAQRQLGTAPAVKATTPAATTPTATTPTATTPVATTPAVTTPAATPEMIQRIEDATFIAEDIKQLKAQGLSTSQIRDNLIMAGVDPSVAGNAVNQSNSSVDGIVKSLTSASAFKETGFFVKDFDPVAAQRELGTAPVAKPVAPTETTPTPTATTPVATTPAATPEMIQRIEDATFIAEDIKQLKAQGLNNSQIRDNLIAAGVDPKVAGNVVNQSNSSVDGIVKYLTTASAYKETGFFKPAVVTPPVVTPPVVTPPVVTPPVVTPPENIQVFDDGSTLVTDPNGNVIRSTNADGTPYVPGSNPLLPVKPTVPEVKAPVTTPPVTTPTENIKVFDDGSTLVTDANGNVIRSTNADGTPYVPGSNPLLPVNQPPTGEKTQIFDDGSTLVTDKDGNVIRSTNSDGTPYVPGSNPLLPINQPPTGETKQIFDDGSTLVTDKDGNVIKVTNSDGTPYVPGSNPLLPINQPVTPEVVTPEVVTPPIVVPPSVIPPYVPPERPVTPVDPYAGSYVGNYSFGTVTPPNTSQGINPGYMPGAVDYRTTSPVQAQFDWSKTAYQPGPQYNPALNPQLPATAWGLQQMYTPMSPEQLLQLTQGGNPYIGLLPAAQGR